MDFERFPPPQTQRPPRDGRDPGEPVRLLSVGRAVSKKGFPDLLLALAELDPALHWRWVHIGGGEQLAALRQQAESFGLSGRIDWLGPQAQETVLRHYRDADLFVLPCRIDPNGDRDGLPNVLMEAQSQGLACLSTRISGIPELIEDGVSGRLLPPSDPAALAAGLAELIADPEQRRRLAAAGLDRVRRDFSMRAGICRLLRKFDLGQAD